ncbi:hypothetical protein [Deinococcus deserti]|nr:hypothetical protein [Deinococcus deserti]
MNGPHFSVRAALALADGQPPPRVAALVAGLTSSKRTAWTQIASVAGTPQPPGDAGLTRLAQWEQEVLPVLGEAQLLARLPHGKTVRDLLLEHHRELLWTAGLIAAQASRVRTA